MSPYSASEPVGNYAIAPTYSDGHDSGIYSWETLYNLGHSSAGTVGRIFGTIGKPQAMNTPQSKTIRRTIRVHYLILGSPGDSYTTMSPWLL